MNCSTRPRGTPGATLNSGAGRYSGPITKSPSASTGALAPAFPMTLKCGAPGPSIARVGGGGCGVGVGAGGGESCATATDLPSAQAMNAARQKSGRRRIGCLQGLRIEDRASADRAILLVERVPEELARDRTASSTRRIGAPAGMRRRTAARSRADGTAGSSVLPPCRPRRRSPGSSLPSTPLPRPCAAG